MLAIPSILDVADQFDAIVFDQWGVLHDGTRAYPGAVAAVSALAARGCVLAVLSNSGKRADTNAERITGMGFAPDAFALVMTSGEALWRDMADGGFPGVASVHAITAAPGDAERWRGDLALAFTTPEAADAILLMGLAEDAGDAADRVLARAGGKLVICSNPDRASPRGDGAIVRSPGALAHDFADAGGRVVFYGKPHAPVFAATQAALGLTDPRRILMVGDSPEHDIAGARAAGWRSLFVAGGLHAGHTGPMAALFPDGAADYALPTLR